MVRRPLVKFVTLTGADDMVAPGALIGLAQEYPFVEWGILASHSATTLSEGRTPRFASLRWLEKLQTGAANYNRFNPQRPLNLSLHLCGHWVRRLLLGKVEFPPCILECFQRVQLNFHAERGDYDTDAFRDALGVFGDREIIFQIDGGDGAALMESTLIDGGPNHVPLYDLSGGAGIVPAQWPRPEYVAQRHADDHGPDRAIFHGFAGGLGPDNLPFELGRIFNACAESQLEVLVIWIDMETKIRNAREEFDLAACRNVLAEMKPFTKSLTA